MHRAVLFLARPWINRSIKKHLNVSYSADAIGKLIWNGWWSYGQLRKNAARENTLGARIMVELAVVSEAFYRELLKHENSKEAAAFAKAMKINYPVILNGGERPPKGWIVPGLPTAYLVGRDGTLVKRWFGAKSTEALTREIELALAK